MSEQIPPTDTPESNATPPAETKDFGTWLKDLRQKRNISLEEIAAVTKIHISQLQHLEENRFEKLPSPAFVRGFIVCYAKHINFDENEILRRFKDATQPEVKETSFPGFANRAAVSSTHPKVKIVETPQIKHAPGSEPREAAKIPITGKHVAVAVVVIILVSTLAFLISLGKKTQITPPENAPATESAPAPSAAAPAAPAAVVPAPAPAPAAPTATFGPQPAPAVAAAATTTSPAAPAVAVGNNTLELKGLEASWINVRVDDKESQGFQLAAGATQRFQVKRKAELSLSNAGVVELRWNGTWYAPPGYRGDVKSFSLPDQVKALAPKGRVAAPKPATPAPAAAVATPAGSP
jgi:cytoskeleton protein RodZ